MQKHFIVFVFSIITFFKCYSQYSEEQLTLSTPTGDLKGSLIVPADVKKFPVMILQPGSGPTDRNGNNIMGVTANSYRLLAEALTKQKIATLLIDKRGIAESAKAMKSEADIRFDDYVNDAVAWKQFIEKDKRVIKIYMAGHSEGSLVGMLAAEKTTFNGYISISGPAQSMDKVLSEQIGKQAPLVSKMVDSMLARLKNNQLLDSVPQMLQFLFRKNVQPYMMSWFKYTPCDEIAKITIPTLIIQGANDIQVDSVEAVTLHQCQPKAETHIISGMNHVLKNSSKVMMENAATYTKPELPVNDELISVIAKFILTKK